MWGFTEAEVRLGALMAGNYSEQQGRSPYSRPASFCTPYTSRNSSCTPIIPSLKLFTFSFFICIFFFLRCFHRSLSALKRCLSESLLTITFWTMAGSSEDDFMQTSSEIDPPPLPPLLFICCFYISVFLMQNKALNIAELIFTLLLLTAFV